MQLILKLNISLLSMQGQTCTFNLLTCGSKRTSFRSQVLLVPFPFNRVIITSQARDDKNLSRHHRLHKRTYTTQRLSLYQCHINFAQAYVFTG